LKLFSRMWDLLVLQRGQAHSHGKQYGGEGGIRTPGRL
jgi:hypothetical protein